jgi:hypothetical protein
MYTTRDAILLVKSVECVGSQGQDANPTYWLMIGVVD